MGKNKAGKLLDMSNLHHYPAQILNSQAVHPDPAASFPGAPPLFGKDVVPHIYTVAGWVGSQARAYPLEDEALRDSTENAERMRRHPDIKECLLARQRAVALLPWHLQPEDEHDPVQKQLVADLTSIVERTHRWVELRRNLMEAIWYGKGFVQLRYGVKQVKGRWRKVAADWEPRHSDKILFRYSDGTNEYVPGQVGIRIHAGARGVNREQIEATQYGLAYWLRDFERRVCIVHKHEIEDGPFLDPRASGRIHGVGLRDSCYWTWYASVEVEQKLLEYLDRTALGIEIWRYPSGNAQAEKEARTAAQERIGGGRSIVMVPVIPGEQADLFGVQHIEPGPQGAELLKTICQDFYAHKLKRLILGQTLTSEAESTGLGSGVADAHLATFSDIIRYDAVNLQESLTDDFIQILKDENFPWAKGIYIRLILNTERPETQEKLAAYEGAWNMGLKVRAEDLYNLIGARRPDEEDEVLQNPNIMMAEQQMAMQQAQAGMPPPGAAPGDPTQVAMGDTGPAVAAMGQGGPPMEVQKSAADQNGAQPVNPWAGFWDSLFAAARGQGVPPPAGQPGVVPPVGNTPPVDNSELTRLFQERFHQLVAVQHQTAAQFRAALETAIAEQPDADNLNLKLGFLFAWKAAEPVRKLQGAMNAALERQTAAQESIPAPEESPDLKGQLMDALQEVSQPTEQAKDQLRAALSDDPVKRAFREAFERQQGPREELLKALRETVAPDQYAAGCGGDLESEDYSLEPATFKYDPWDGLPGDGTRTSAFTIQAPHGPVSYEAGLETLPTTDQPRSLPDHLGPAKSFAFGNKGSEDPYGITGTGAAQQVFGHVGGLVLHALKDQRPAYVHFNGIEESRRKLYRAMMNRLPEHTDDYLPYMMTHRGNDIGSYFLVHRDHAPAFEEQHKTMWQPAGNPYAITPLKAKKQRATPPLAAQQPAPDQYTQGPEGIRGSSTAGTPVPPRDPQADESPLVEADRPAALGISMDDAIARYRAGEWSSEDLDRYALDRSFEMVN